MIVRANILTLVLLDVVSSIVVFNLISFARGILGSGQLVVWPLVMPIAAFLIAVYLIQGYRPRTDMLSVDYASQHAIAAAGAMLATLMFTYVFIPAGYELQSSRFVIALSFVALTPLTLGYRRLFYLSSANRQTKRSIVFVGDHASCGFFKGEIERMGVSQPVIYTSAVPESGTVETIHSSAPTVRAFDQVLSEIFNGQLAVEAIVLRESARELAAKASQQLVQLYFAGVPTYTLELFHEVYWQKIPLYRLNQTWLFQEGFQIAREPVFERAKRAADIVLSSIGLILAFPFLILAGIAIWVEDRGPIFFVQSRIGKNHTAFRLFKLRSMRVSRESGSRYTQPGDVRITRVGRFLRASRIDEFPQLWNVLRGEMSLIGPRAEWDKLVEEYEQAIPCYHFRHLVKPGITGWAQVNYPYGASVEDTQRKLEYDLYYIRHFSFRLDATIVLKTIHIMLFGKGR
jgi:exopolysaccharide biosynthesis polyprenyl glycosylphosphotransferase